MTLKKIYLLIIATFILSFTFISDVSDNMKYNMFVKALNTYSSSPYYIVIKVKNQNTGEIKEICTEAPSLGGALYFEFKYDIFKVDNIAKSHIDRYFEFSNDTALENIYFDLYTQKDLKNYERLINLKKIIKEIQSGKCTGKTFPNKKAEKGQTFKKQVMLAHLLFNNGIMTSRGCIAGNVVYFEVYQEDK